jgi:hypothetical protein
VTQRRRHSLLEALASTFFGFLISIAVWPPISVHVLHKPPAAAEGFAVVGIYTVISIVRGYVVRRCFNRLHAREHECGVCGKPAAMRGGAAWFCEYHGRRLVRR